jgi:hypothetical protein
MIQTSEIDPEFKPGGNVNPAISKVLPAPQKKMRGERSRRLAYPQSGICSRSNPSPGTRISTPVFGCELFVAHLQNDTKAHSGNRKLFTAAHPIRARF